MRRAFSFLQKCLPVTPKSPQPLHSHFLRNFSANKFPPPPPPLSDKSSSLLKTAKILEPHRPIHLINKAERLKASEEDARKLNLGVLRRELMNDCVQLPLKYFAWKSAPLHVAPTFLAELTRASIDALNHVILFLINRLSVAPSAKYPYGMDKIKNATALIPAALFLYFGAETMYSSFIELMYEPTVLAHEHDYSMWPFIAYATSISVELGIVVKNILDATHDKSNENQTMASRLKNLFKKKDPLLQVVLYENAITLTSSSIPLIFSGIDVFYPIPWLDSVGSFMIGGIEMYVGYHLADENVPTLIGEGVDNQTYEAIIKTIKENPYVTEVKNVKTILIGPNKFKVVAEITYELDKLTERVLETYRHVIDQIIYEQEYEDRQDYIETALGLLPKRFMKEIQIQNNSIEEKLTERFPDCVHIDIEIDHNQLLNYSDNIEKVKNFTTMNLEKHPLIHEPWIDEAINRILGKDFEQKLKYPKNFIHYRPDEKLDKSFLNYTMNVDEDYIYECTIVDEDERFEILQEHLEQEDSNRQYEEFELL